MALHDFEMDRRGFLTALGCSALASSTLWAANPGRIGAKRDFLRPFEGTSHTGVNPKTLHGKVMCGYQGWFNARGDGAGRGWVHWVKDGGELRPGNVSVDLWPDMTELGAEERFKTGFRHADGRVAEVFSSYCKPTVLRHFRWMRDYGIDGAFVQRFISDMSKPAAFRHHNAVLAHAREGANRFGRTYALMYDLSGLGHGKIDRVIEDLRVLRAKMRLMDDPAYLHHRGRPLIAVWGTGFRGPKRQSIAECRQLVHALKHDPRFGGLTVMLGVPTHWRKLEHDARPDPALHELLKMADVISPWTVGRFGTPEQARSFAEGIAALDLAWCRKHGLDYLPVAFPGFSWTNLHGGELGQIPRRGGEFLWSQACAMRKLGAQMLYVAMFDEVDEATAIFKCTNDPPQSEISPFLTYEGLPSDHYLKVTGRIGAMFRGELPPTQSLQQAMGVERVP